jgi:hypothetical protein
VVLDGAAPLHGRDATLAVARTLDRARRAAGVIDLAAAPTGG